MTIVRERPLTLEFWIGMACLDLAALATSYESKFADALVLGKLLIVGGWLIVGGGNRLLRAGVWIAALAAVTAPDFVIPRLRGGFYIDLVWPHVLAMFICTAVGAAGTTACWLAAARLSSRGLSHMLRGPLRFSLLEMLGWMIVVAVASVGLRLADFSLIGDFKQISIGMAYVTIGGAIMALALGDYSEGRTKQRVPAVAAAVCVIAFALGLLVRFVPSREWPVLLGGLACTSIWTAALWVDRRRSAHQLRSFAA